MSRRDALARLMPFQMGFLGSAALYVAASLEIADRLCGGARASDDLAAETGVDPAMLYRILRYLASEGIFEEAPERTFRLNEVAELLRTDVEQSFQPFTIMNTERAFASALELLPAVRDGDIPFVRRFGRHPFEMMHEDPDAAAALERGWQGVHGPETAAFLEAYDFTGIECLADIGGGHGDVIVGFLEGDPARRGVLFDIPAVTGQAGRRLDAARTARS